MEREGENLLTGFMNFLLTLDFGYSLQPKKQMFSWQCEKTASSAKIDNKAVQGAKTHARLQRGDSAKRPSPHLLQKDPQWKEKPSPCPQMNSNMSFLLDPGRKHPAQQTQTHRRRPSLLNSLLPAKLGQALKNSLLRNKFDLTLGFFLADAYAHACIRHTNPLHTNTVYDALAISFYHG